MQQQPFHRDQKEDQVAETWNVRWDCPSADPWNPSHTAIPAFEAQKYRVMRLEQDEALGGYSVAPKQNNWESDPWPEPPPAAPTGQWWAGWLPDPKHRYEFRYWDGSGWTNHVASGGVTGFDLV
jgi:hypothetical protein